jgi:hypothetical protein
MAEGVLEDAAMSWMTQVPEFLLYLLIYFVIFAGIGMLFYGTDRLVRRRLRRSVRCAFCGKEFDFSLLQQRFGRCPYCGKLQPQFDRSAR